MSGPRLSNIINIIGGARTMDNIIITSIYGVYFDRVKPFIKSYFFFFFVFP